MKPVQLCVAMDGQDSQPAESNMQEE